MLIKDLLKSLRINTENHFTIDQVRNFWDKTAPAYESSNEQFKDTHLQRFEEAVKCLNLKPDQRILNIWSRTGLAIPYLRRKCPNLEIINLEVSPEFIKIAQEKFPREKFQETNLNNLPFENNYFDHILSLETLEHTPGPLAFLKELFRVLKPNGSLVMSCPPAAAEIPLKIYGFLFANHGEGPHKFLPSKEVKNLLKKAGFKIILHKGTLLIPLGPKWLKKIGEKIINKLQKTPVRELGIRQFYICQKQNEKEKENNFNL